MNATKVVLDWIAGHPYQTVFQIVNGVIICTPAAATIPVFAALGFSAGGPLPGSGAAAVMSYFGIVPAGGWYAMFQSAAMGGYGASAAAGAAQAGAVLSSVAGWVWGRNSTGG
ncbi:uncharacterized protein EKO05_0011304 [Ascochyta rabiei]|uniref:Uncharacterized protein n=1 Tax=Didymella rabiei TaxID=5454 RepID=A0A162WEB9_DIDRA|nr:uncharacterized protein EKO05_0011304 [Ascochyta rabiei]KZM18976.1 hypothetical protein ST47_g9888 [Ascochyta rabiei]UPX21102.1 hypothetical protein EKO05_0011304 [Ascochyta rabiei]